MADEYIKRKNVLECIKESRDGIDWGQSEDGDAFLHYSACLYRTIASNECFPSADVQPVVHGKWISNGDPDSNGNALYKCSICHFKDKHAVHLEVPYCWHCGARMDGGT